MPNKKINQLDVRVAVATDLMLVGDPTTGTSYKSTVATLPLVPYTGATGAVSLGLYGLTAGSLTLQPQPLNVSTYSIGQTMATNDSWRIYGFATVADYGDLYFELQDNGAFADGQRFRFHYGNASSGTPKDILLMDYNSATIDGALQVNNLAGTGTRMVVTDANGALSTQGIPTGSASGGSSVSYYLNGSVNQGTIGGSVYYEINKTAVIGTGTNFTRLNSAGNGLIAQFITDANDPNRLEIPSGAWNFEMYFSSSSSGGSPSFYVELLKYDGTTFTSIANGVSNPEVINGGTSVDLYLNSLAVPQTTLLATDRLAVRVYVTTSGKDITLYTEDNRLSEIITTFAGGVSALNGLTANTQYLATGTSGTNFAISSVGDTHTFNLPTASATNRGALSSADWTTFNAKQAALTLTTTGTSGAATLVGATLNIPQYSGGGGMAIGGAITSATAGSVLFAGASGVLQQDNANLFWDDTNNRLGIGTATPSLQLDVKANANGFRGMLISNTNTGTSSVTAFQIGQTPDVSPYNALYFVNYGSSYSTSGSAIASSNAFTSGVGSSGGLSFIVDAESAPIRFYARNSGVQVLKMQMFNTGNFLLQNGGTFADQGYRLDVQGTARVSDILTLTTGTTKGIVFAGTKIVEPISASTYTQVLIQPSSGNKDAVFQFSPSGTSTASVMEFYANSGLTQASRFVFKNNNSVLQIGADGAPLPLTFISQNSTKFTMFGNGNFIFQNGGTHTDIPCAAVNISSTTQGLLFPKMTTTQKNAITPVVSGLVVFDITLNKLCVYSGTSWETITSL